MNTFLLVLTIIVALALIGIILIQRSEGGGLGASSSQGASAFMSGRSAANFLTHSTAVLAGLFMLLCLTLAVLDRGQAGNGGGKDILAIPPAQTGPDHMPETGKTPAARTHDSHDMQNMPAGPSATSPAKNH